MRSQHVKVAPKIVKVKRCSYIKCAHGFFMSVVSIPVQFCFQFESLKLTQTW